MPLVQTIATLVSSGPHDIIGLKLALWNNSKVVYVSEGAIPKDVFKAGLASGGWYVKASTNPDITVLTDWCALPAPLEPVEV